MLEFYSVAGEKKIQVGILLESRRILKKTFSPGIPSPKSYGFTVGFAHTRRKDLCKFSKTQQELPVLFNFPSVTVGMDISALSRSRGSIRRITLDAKRMEMLSWVSGT